MSRLFSQKNDASPNDAYTWGLSNSVEVRNPRKSVSDIVGFGKRLAALRKAAGFTQEELSREIGVSRRMIAYYEGETRHPPTTILPRLAQALGLSVDDLLNGDSRREAPLRPMSERLRRKLQELEKLGVQEKRKALQLLDMFIEREQHKRRT
jgi:transcriptional regulator with XRE-family HTH domain